jgi:hypothetical protein
MKRHILPVLLLFFTITAWCSEEPGKPELNENKSKTAHDSGRFSFPDREDITMIGYWSSVGTTGFTALVNSFALTGYAWQSSRSLHSLASDIEADVGTSIPYLSTIADAYTPVVFGVNFLLAGLACIPRAGGFIYGSLLYTIGVLFAVLQTLDPVGFTWFAQVPSAQQASFNTRINSTHDSLFDPAPYFAVGTISILFSIVQVVFGILYDREIKKRKYPYLQKAFAVTADGFIIRLAI